MWQVELRHYKSALTTHSALLTKHSSLQGNMVLQLTMQEPKRVAELTCEFKKQTPPDAAALWAKCLVRACTQLMLSAMMRGQSIQQIRAMHIVLLWTLQAKFT